MTALVGIVVWILTGVAVSAMGGEFFSGVVFLLGGLLGAIAAGFVAVWATTRRQ